MESSHFQVPWYSMAEWSLVYRQTYSSNIEDMKKAYRRLLVWKSRVLNLPAGVECTLGVLQVRLRELEVSSMKEKVLSNEDLQLMYSTSIIRFLNMIAELEQGQNQAGSSTLYFKAQGMAIPSWIVNLRHDAAHSTTLPPLHSLKSAADFIFNWLNDYYWKNETQHIQDYYIEDPSTGRVYRKKIRTVLTLLKIYLEIAASESSVVSEETLAKLIALIPSISTRKKHAALNEIVRGMSVTLKREEQKHVILEHIVQETDFLNCNLDTKSKTQLSNEWIPILNMLNKHNLLLDFTRLLVEVATRNQDEAKCEQAAKWINEICRGYLKLERCLHIQLDLARRDIGTSLSAKQKFLLVLKVSDTNYNKLKTAMVLKGKLPPALQFRGLLEEALQGPSRHTFVFLDSLCFVSHVPKPPLLQLLHLYLNTTSTPSHGSQLSTVFTLEALTRLSGESLPASREKQSLAADRLGESQDALWTEAVSELNGAAGCSQDVEMEENVWRLADDLDWSHCPLGRVPGDSEDMYLDMDVLGA